MRFELRTQTGNGKSEALNFKWEPTMLLQSKCKSLSKPAASKSIKLQSQTLFPLFVRAAVIFAYDIEIRYLASKSS